MAVTSKQHKKHTKKRKKKQQPPASPPPLLCGAATDPGELGDLSCCRRRRRRRRSPFSSRKRLPWDLYSSMSSSHRPRVLLVEDAEINRVVVRRMARELNVAVDEAENGLAAVELLRRGRHYDFILMDKDMPVMDGHQATRQLRSLGVTTPIVALSGNGLPSDRDLFLLAGADEFHSKPLSKTQFVGLLARYG